MTSLANRFFKGFVWNQGVKIIEMVLSFISSVILARLLGVRDYGLLTSIVTAMSLVSFFSAFGFEEILNFYSAKLAVQKGESASGILLRRLVILRTIIYLGIVFFLYNFSPLIASILGFPSVSNYLRLASFYFFFGGIASLLLFNFFGLLLVKEVIWVRVASSASGLILTIVALGVLHLGISGQLWSMGLSSLLTFLLYFFASQRSKFFKPLPKEFNMRPLFIFGATIWFTNLVNYVLGKQFDILILGHFLQDARILGFYSLAFSIVTILGTLMTMGAAGVSTATFAEIAEKKEWAKLRLALRVHIKLDSFLLIPPVVFALYFGRQIIGAIYGSAYQPAYIFLIIFGVFNVLVRPFGGGTTTSVLYAINLEKLVLFLRALMGGFNIILALLFLVFLKMGAVGIALATGIVGLSLGVAEFLALFKTFKPSVPILYHFKLLLAISGGMLAVLWFNPTNVFFLFLTAIFFALVTTLILMLLRPIDDEEYPLLQKVLPPFAIDIMHKSHLWKR